MAREEGSGRQQMEDREMGADYRDVYETHRIELVENLRVHRTFLFDYLRSKKVLDTEDCELIQAEVTRERKAGKLLDLLRYKGEGGFTCFTEALQLQSPELYKTLTGKDADSTPNPIIKRCQNSSSRREGGMEDVEIELLTEHLSSSYAELQRMTSKYNNIVKEKRKLESQLRDDEIDMERQKRQTSVWEERFKQEKTCSLKKQCRAEQYMFTMNSEIELSGETIKILQGEICSFKMQMLQANEEIEELKATLSEANRKKDEEIRYRQEIGENFQKERKQAARLSLKIKNQVGEIQALDHYKRKCEELDFTNEEVKKRNEKLQKELNELAKWTKGLKDRFDLIEIENVQAHESNKNVEQNIKALQDETKMFKQKSSYFEVENDFLKFRVTCLEKDCEIYKQQRDNAMTSRSEAAEERDKVWRERELAWHNYIEMQKARDVEIEKRESSMKQLDEKDAKFNETFLDLAKTKLKLNEAKLKVEELECTINDIRKIEKTNDEKKNPVENEPAKRQDSEEEEEEEEEKEEEEEEEEGEEEEEVQTPFQKYRLHSKKDLIQSVKRRIQKHDGCTCSNNASLARRTPSFDFLMSMVCEDNDSNEGPFSLNKWASCPELDDIGQKENGKSRSVTIPGYNNPREPNMYSTETNTSTSSDSDNSESYRCLRDGYEGFLLADKPFRRRSNVMSSSVDMPLMKYFKLRKKKQVQVKSAEKKE